MGGAWRVGEIGALWWVQEAGVSLRDQLVSKGLASKKQARHAERELKKARKQSQSKKVRKGEQDLARREEAEREAQARREQSERDRRAAEEARLAHEHGYRTRQIIEAHRMGGRGPVRFYVRAGQTRRLLRMSLPEAMVRDLRMGRAAVAGYFDERGSPVLRVVGPRAVAKLTEVAPEALWHLVRDGGALDDPSEGVWSCRDWDPSLRPHRWKASADGTGEQP